MTERVWHIRNCSLFRQLTPDQLSELEQGARLKTFPRDAAVYLPSDVSDGAFLLAEGRLRICSVTPDGRQAILAFVEPGELFGELALVEPGLQEDRAEAVVKSTVILLPGERLRRLVAASHALSLGVTRLIGLRRRRVERRLRSLLFRSNRDRLLQLLLDLVEQYGDRSGTEIRLGIRLSHQELASIIGCTRETVTMLLGEMQLSGLLTVSRRRIVIRNLSQLAAELGVNPPSVPRDTSPPPAVGELPLRSLEAGGLPD